MVPKNYVTAKNARYYGRFKCEGDSKPSKLELPWAFDPKNDEKPWDLGVSYVQTNTIFVG